MADNVTLDPGPNPSITYKSDDVGSGVQVPYLKIDKGADGASSPVTDANPFPISAAALPLPADAATETTLASRASEATLSSILTELQAKTEPANTQTIAGTVTANLGTIAGVATETTLGSILTELQAKTEPANTQTIAGTVTANLGTIAGVATEVTLGSILTELQQKTEPANTQAISAASLPLPTGAATSALQTTGNTSLATIESGLTVDARGSSNGMVGLGYDAAGFAYNSIDINTSGAALIRNEEHTSTTGTITANGQTVALTLGRNNNVAFSISGTYGSVAIIFEASLDNVLWGTLQACRWGANTVETASGTISNTTRFWEASVNGANYFRVRATAYGSGTANIRISACVSATEPVPAIATHAVTGSGTFAATQSGTWSTRTQDGSGNLIPSTNTTPGTSDRGLTTRSFAYLHDAVGGKISSGASAVAYDQVGLSVRKPADVYIDSSQEGTLVAPRGYYFYASRTTAAGSTTTVINTTTDPSTQCRRGDMIRVASGTHAEGIYQQGIVSSVTSSTITLQYPLTIAPPTTRTINIYKPLAPACDASGYSFVNSIAYTNVPTYPVYSNKFFGESGSLAFGSISGAYATIYTTGQQIAVIVVVNGTNVPLVFSFDSGSTDWIMVPAGQTFTLPAIQNGGYVDGLVDIQVKDLGSAAASGSAWYFGYYF